MSTSNKTFDVRITNKKDSAANWETANPVLLNGEIIFVTDSNSNGVKAKVGDGSSNYSALPFLIGASEANGTTAATATLYVNNWDTSTNTQTITINGLGADTNGIIGLAQGASQEQISAAMSANIYVSGQSENTLMVTANNSLPEIDLPILVVMLPTEGGGSGITTTTTLSASAWDSKKQIITISGLSATANGSIGLAQNVTEAQFNAAMQAELYITAQNTNSLTVAAKNIVPTVDIPIIITILE